MEDNDANTTECYTGVLLQCNSVHQVKAIRHRHEILAVNVSSSARINIYKLWDLEQKEAGIIKFAKECIIEMQRSLEFAEWFEFSEQDRDKLCIKIR